MRFFDCNTYYGLPPFRHLNPVETAADLLAEMDRNHVEKALVWHISQQHASAQKGNQILADGIQPYPRLIGCWTILPTQSLEQPKRKDFFIQMKEKRIGAVRVFPDKHNFLLHPLAMEAWFEELSARHIPLLVSTARGCEWLDIYRVLEAFPNLYCIICDHGVWGRDRLFRPLLEHFPHVYVDTSLYLLDGGIESLVQDFGSHHLCFGSGFPDQYIGGMMLALKHAEISEEDKEAIACGNLEHILAEVLP